VNKTDLLFLSKTRIKEAKILLNNGAYHGAYYLSGYAVECAVKACIAGQQRKNVVPEREFLKNFYQHDLGNLLRNSGLWTKFETEMKSNIPLAVNWALVKDWNESSRYLNGISKAQATDLLKAITARKTGILGWIKKCI